jgi:hypothetical protein
VYGGFVLDHLAANPAVAWMVISSLAALSGMGYLLFARILPESINRRGKQDEATGGSEKA